MNETVTLHFPEERILAGFEFVQALPHVGVGLLVEAAAGLADRNKPALVVVKSEHDRAEVLARAARIGVASYDAFLVFDNFDLQPFTAALLQITAVATLGDDAFQAALRCGRKNCRAIAHPMIRI